METFIVKVILCVISLVSTEGFKISQRLNLINVKPFQELTRLHSSISEVSDVSDRSVRLNWAHLNDTGSYKVEYTRLANGPYNMIAISSQSITLKNLAPGSKYDYKITALGYGNDSIICSGNFMTAQQTSSSEGIAKAEVTDLSRLEIRIGKIVEIAKHPEADTLYVEKVDVGEAEPRTIVSGLVEFCSLESLQGREVVVLCNLKPRPLKGITSFGMLLCASNADKSQVDPLRPPSGVALGQLVTFAGHASEPAEPGNRASKSFSKVADDFFVDEAGQATYKGVAFMTPQGPCTSHLKGKIS